MDAVFKALNDPTRRQLLDALRQKDGQTLTQLVEQLDMTRFGVAKHLGLLEDAHLITTIKKGRFKYHYLNAVPLQEVIDRWIEPLLAKPAARGMLALKTHLEKESTMLDTTKPDLVLHTYIDCTHDALWDALTSAEAKAKYHFASNHITGGMAAKDEAIILHKPDGAMMLTEKVLSVTPKSRIETTFQPGWVEAADASRCVFLLEPTPAGMKLTVEHYDTGDGYDGVQDGWSRVFAGLKTYLETGRAHPFPREEPAQ